MIGSDVYTCTIAQPSLPPPHITHPPLTKPVRGSLWPPHTSCYHFCSPNDGPHTGLTTPSALQTSERDFHGLAHPPPPPPLSKQAREVFMVPTHPPPLPSTLQTSARGFRRPTPHHPWPKERPAPSAQSGGVGSPPPATPTSDMSDFTTLGDIGGKHTLPPCLVALRLCTKYRSRDSN
jgi:hypothetical protein